jgi:predicted nucleotidyltransferase
MNPLKPLFFQDTLRHWHFEAMLQEANLSRERVHFYLKLLLRENFITRIKPRGKGPYYIAKRDEPAFRSEKRLYGLLLLDQSGLFEQLSRNPKIKTAILFGSFARGDWGTSSDVDLFLYGADQDFNQGLVEQKLGRTIQLFSFQHAQAMKEALAPALIPNIIKGFNIKSTVEPFKVLLNA